MNLNDLRSFKFGGVWLGTYKVFLLPREDTVLPRTRDKTIVVPGRPGLLDLGAELGERPLPLPCVLIAETEEDYWLNREALATIFNPAKGEQDLIFDDMPTKKIRARYSGTLTVPQILQWCEFELPLVAYDDPYFYTLAQDTEMWAVTQNDQTYTLQKDAMSIEEFPTIRVTNTGAGPIENIQITRVNTP